MTISLGLDCGGSSSRALAQNESGEAVFQGQSGPANIATTPHKRLQRNLSRALAGCPLPDAVCGCFAGLLTSEDRDRAVALLQEFFPKAKARAEPDYAAALLASDEGTDICVIAGTGSIVCSRYEDRIVKSGGRGYLLGDWGSAYQYGKVALEHYLKQPQKASSQLIAAIQERFGSMEESEILASLYRGGAPAASLARLLPAFVKDVRTDEPYAIEILENQTKRLAEVVQQHAESYFRGKNILTISLSGGLWEASGIFRNAFEVQCRELMPDMKIEMHRIQQPPVRGAVLLARELIG